MVGYLFSILLVILNLQFEQSYNKIGYVQRGVSSYYADDFHGKKTANGEKFDMNSLTAAHPRIRFNTLLKVTNLDNGKSVIVRVNDRGPYVGGRILDLSRAAAQKIDMIRNGTAQITAEVIAVEPLPTVEDIAKNKPKNKEVDSQTTKEQPKEEMQRKTKIGGLLAKIKDALVGKNPKIEQPKPLPPIKKDTQTQQETKKQPTPPVKEEQPKQEPKIQPKIQTTPPPVNNPNVEAEEEAPRPKPVTKQTTNNPTNTTTNTTTNSTIAINESNFIAMNTYNIWGTEKFPDGYGVQIGSYSDFAKAMEIGKGVQQTNIATAYVQVGISGDKKVYRIVAGEGDANNAKTLINLLKDKGYAGVFMKQHY